MAPQLTPLQRMQIIALRESGCRIIDIQRRTGIGRKSIYFWLHRHETTGGDITPHRRQIYHRATTAEQDAAIIAAHRNNKMRSTRQTAMDYNISLETVRRRLKESKNVKKKAPAKKHPVIKVKTKRVVCSKNVNHASEEFLNKMMLNVNASEQKKYPEKQEYPEVPCIELSAEEKNDSIIICDSCFQDINDKRYICLECPDFTLCKQCEREGKHDTHYVLRIPSKRPADETKAVVSLLRQQLLNSKSDLNKDVTATEDDAISVESGEDVEETPSENVVTHTAAKIHGLEETEIKVEVSDNEFDPLMDQVTPQVNETQAAMFAVITPKEEDTEQEKYIITENPSNVQFRVKTEPDDIEKFPGTSQMYQHASPTYSSQTKLTVTLDPTGMVEFKKKPVSLFNTIDNTKLTRLKRRHKNNTIEASKAKGKKFTANVKEDGRVEINEELIESENNITDESET